ncbi:MAG: hypothetical protein V3V62_04365 [bacterium]
MAEAQIQRYSRHILLPQVGGKGQEKLLGAAVLIAFAPEGAGAASCAAVYLAAAGVGRIGWRRVSSPEEGVAKEEGSLAGLVSLYHPEGEAASLAALNPDARLEVVAEPEAGEDSEAAAGGWDLALLSGGGTRLAALARIFLAAGRPLLRGVRRGWSGAVLAGEAAAEEDDMDDFSPAEDEELLPPASPEGVLGAMLASSALGALLGKDEETVGSTALARFDLSRGRFWAAAR